MTVTIVSKLEKWTVERRISLNTVNAPYNTFIIIVYCSLMFNSSYDDSHHLNIYISKMNLSKNVKMMTL